MRQTSLPTAWLIFLNSQTPREALDRLDTLIAPYPFIKYVPSEEFSVEFAADCIRSQKSPDCEWIVTTRLDTDDAIHARLFESVRNAVSIGTYEFLNAPTGLVVFKGRFYREQDLSNAFISASEPAGNFKTVYLDQHINLSRYAPIRQLALSDAWMQIVHGDNIANRVRGVRVPSYTVKKEWQWIPHTLEAEIRKERAGEMIADNSIGFAARFGASLMRWLRTQTKRPDVPNS